MSDVLEGADPPKPSLREDANAPRIGRARFIGHTIGVLLILAVVTGGLSFAGLHETIAIGGQPAVVPNRYLVLVMSILLLLALIDLAVRRRHDRGRSGIDCAILLVLGEAAIAARLLGYWPAGLPMAAVAGVCVIVALYLVLMLVLLPGNRGANRYGPPPRAD